MIGDATNPDGLTASIDLGFGGWVDNHSYKGPGDSNDADFFTTVLGTITIGATIYDIGQFVNPYAFQYGLGANDKDPNEFGGSAWIQSPGSCANTCMSSHHWDLNMTSAAVPEPAPLALLGVGMLIVEIGRAHV